MKVTTCPQCDGPKDRPGQSYCRACHNAQMRRTRRLYSELSDAEQHKAITRGKTRYLLKIGRLITDFCADCNGYDVEAHHLDYDKPDLVTWLCQACHESGAVAPVYPS